MRHTIICLVPGEPAWFRLEVALDDSGHLAVVVISRRGDQTVIGEAASPEVAQAVRHVLLAAGLDALAS